MDPTSLAETVFRPRLDELVGFEKKSRKVVGGHWARMQSPEWLWPDGFFQLIMPSSSSASLPSTNSYCKLRSCNWWQKPARKAPLEADLDKSTTSLLDRCLELKMFHASSAHAKKQIICRSWWCCGATALAATTRLHATCTTLHLALELAFQFTRCSLQMWAANR